MFHFLLSLFFVSFTLLFTLCFVLYKKKLNRNHINEPGQNPNPETKQHIEEKDEVLKTIRDQETENDRTLLPHSLLLEILPSDSAKWAGLLSENGEGPDSVGSGQEKEALDGGDQRGVKKKKRRGKKKRLDSSGGEEEDDKRGEVFEREKNSGNRVNPELVCLYPFTSTSSATQRKIKQQYDQLVKCHEKSGLTLAQVGEFANCLIQARTELQHKAEVIKRKFTITKALLFKADISSFDRLRQQIYKLEMEQKRLEEDAFVYNWLQQQLKLSPAYKKMLEITACMEMEAKSGKLMESTDAEFADISFEELLAQEKKDSFWQKNGKSKLCSS